MVNIKQVDFRQEPNGNKYMRLISSKLKSNGNMTFGYKIESNDRGKNYYYNIENDHSKGYGKRKLTNMTKTLLSREGFHIGHNWLHLITSEACMMMESMDSVNVYLQSSQAVGTRATEFNSELAKTQVQIEAVVMRKLSFRLIPGVLEKLNS